MIIAPLAKKQSVAEKQLEAIDSTFIGKGNTEIQYKDRDGKENSKGQDSTISDVLL